VFSSIRASQTEAAEGYEGLTTPLSTPGYEFCRPTDSTACLGLRCQSSARVAKVVAIGYALLHLRQRNWQKADY
jgi:hypothetical protein